MCQNYTYDVQTQVVSAFGGVSATDREVGSNHCPDEKGTERTQSGGCPGFVLRSVVATIAPMKRGLKGSERRGPARLPTGSNHCPDEKGTESNHITPR